MSVAAATEDHALSRNDACACFYRRTMSLESSYYVPRCWTSRAPLFKHRRSTWFSATARNSSPER
eukprot:3172130-Pleurochrysis_carterae.AAC.1